MLAGGIFVASTATIAYAIPSDHTSADAYKPGITAKNSHLKNIIDTGFEKLKAKYPILRCPEKPKAKYPTLFPAKTEGSIKYKPWMTIYIHSRPIRGLIGAAIGSVCLLGVGDLYLKLNITGTDGEKS